MNRGHVASCVVALLGCAGVARGAGAGDTTVADAAMRGDTASVRRLILARADVNAPQADRATALHWAVYRDDLEAADLLLRAGAHASAANREGTTPIVTAALSRDAATIDRPFQAATENAASTIAGRTWHTLDDAEGLVRVGVQSAIPHPDTAALVRRLMAERGRPVPPPNRNSDSICVVERCQ